MKKDTTIIPKGDYCYDESDLCPYWSTNSNYHEQDCGYCSYLEKGDWEMNDEKKWKTTYRKDGKELSDELRSANEIGIPMSLLWDQVKECGINIEEEE